MNTLTIVTKRLVIISDEFELRILDDIYARAVNFYNKSLDEIEKIFEEDLTSVVLELYDDVLNADVCFLLWEDAFLAEVQPIIAELGE